MTCTDFQAEQQARLAAERQKRAQLGIRTDETGTLICASSDQTAMGIPDCFRLQVPCFSPNAHICSLLMHSDNIFAPKPRGAVPPQGSSLGGNPFSPRRSTSPPPPQPPSTSFSRPPALQTQPAPQNAVSLSPPRIPSSLCLCLSVSPPLSVSLSLSPCLWLMYVYPQFSKPEARGSATGIRPGQLCLSLITLVSPFRFGGSR